MARLKQWDDQHRQHLMELLAYNYDIANAYQILQAAYGENLYEYSYNAVKDYVHSTQGKQDYLKTLAGVKEAVKERGFGDSDHRLTGLTEVALELLQKFRMASAASEYQAMGTLSREFRETMKAIREELGHGVIDTTEATSFFDRLKEVADGLPPDEHKALFGKDKGEDLGVTPN